MSVYRISDMLADLKEMRRSTSARKGLPTGFTDLDELMTLDTGYLSICTGYPSSGKSEFLDAILTNMAILHGWKSLIFSPENFPLAEHAKKIVEKVAGGPLRGTAASELNDAVAFIDQHFAWMYPADDKIKLQSILEIAHSEHESRPYQALVIDPWNELDHSDQGGKRDDQYISAQLTVLRRFIREHNVHCFIVIHPHAPKDKRPDGTYPVPTLYDCNGGAMWRNKADYGWAAYRNPNENIMQLFVQKIKFKSMGRVGKVDFAYDWQSGRFKGPSQSDFSLPYPDGNEPPF